MAKIKTYRPSIAEVKGGVEWSALEAALLAACRSGRMAILPGKHGLPADTSDPDRRVRAGLIRYLMLGGCGSADGARPHPMGVGVAGGWIDGALELQGCHSALNLALGNCRLTERANLLDARLGALYLPGCAAPKGLHLHRLTTRRSVHLCDKFTSEATIDLCGARIGGQLNCDRGVFAKVNGFALDCDAARIGADVFLRKCTIVGGADFVRADIAGNFRIEGSRLEAGIDLEASRIGHGLFWQSVTGDRRLVNLTEARVGSLRDDWQSWDGVGRLRLGGFRYERLDASMSVAERIRWLNRAQHRDLPAGGGAPDWARGPDFDPQPHVQLASVLRAQGDRDGAARVLVDREWCQRRADRQRRWRQAENPRGDLRWWMSLLQRPVDFLFWLLFGYGHRPVRALLASIGFVVVAALLAGAAYDAGQFAPNSDIILTSQPWIEAVALHEAGGPLPLLTWLGSPSAQDYETFNRWLYGLDLFVPLDALGQETAWRPSTERGGLGWFAFYSRAFFQSAGWIITALAAAVLTGLVGRRD